METPYALYDALSAIEVPPDKVRAVVQSMERDMALYATQPQFAALDRNSATRFDQLERRFDAIDRHFEQVDRRFAEIERRFQQIDQRFEVVDERFALLQQRIDALDHKLEGALRAMEQRLIVRLGSFLAVAVGVTAGLVKLLGG